MVAWAISGFGGSLPRVDPDLLPDKAAEEAVNCDLASGSLAGLPVPETIVYLAGAQRAYRFPLTGYPDVWLPLPSPYSSVCRSPLSNDTSRRVYWTNPPDSSQPGQFWNTRDRIAAGTPPYHLGIVQPNPDSSTLTVTATGGTTTVPKISRSYTWTYVDQYGEESAPNYPSAVVDGEPDAAWVIAGIPGSPPANPADKNYPPITGVKLYRTSTGTETGAQFYVVAEWTFAVTAPPNPYTDGLPDTTAVNNLPLISTAWANPPAALDGLTMLPGGMLVGFTTNTIHFCEPNRPHAWPPAYDQSVNYPIVGFGVWMQSLTILTQGFPSTGSGNSPSNFVISQAQVPEPVISRGSIVTDLDGVYYASQNGIIQLTNAGMKNISSQLLSKNIWLNDFHGTQLIACRHRSQYLAMRTDGSGTGFVIDYAEERLGVVKLSTLAGATCIWNDEFSGDAYVCAGGTVYRWDSATTPPLTYRWKSKHFYGPMPISVGACHVSLDSEVLIPPTPITVPMDTHDPTLTLPAGVNAVIHIYAGPDAQHLVLSRPLTEVRSIFRVPGGFKAYGWQVEVVSRVGIGLIKLASTMKELRGAS